MKHRESQEQRALIKWARMMENQFPDLKYLHASLNGVHLTVIQSSCAKQQGMLAGVPDLFLPTKRGCFSGIFIEMKFGKNKTTPAQQDFLEYVTTQGFYGVVCYSWFEAKNALEEYLKM